MEKNLRAMQSMDKYEILLSFGCERDRDLCKGVIFDAIEKKLCSGIRRSARMSDKELEDYEKQSNEQPLRA